MIIKNSPGRELAMGSIVEIFSEFAEPLKKRMAFSDHNFHNDWEGRKRHRLLEEIDGQVFDSVEQFIQYSDKYIRSSSYHESVISNPWHLEGDVWTHTMMVCKVAEMLNVPKEVKISALLHDIGKPESMEILKDKGRVRFFGHEGLSFFMAIDLLTGEFGKALKLKTNEIKTILRLIACHSDIFTHGEGNHIDGFSKSHDFLKLLVEQARCDSLGRVVGGDVKPDTKYLNNIRAGRLEERTNINTEKPTITLLCGLQGAGKSTLCEYLDGDIVSRDAILEDTTEGNTYNEKWINHDPKKVDSIFHNTLLQKIRERRDIIVDRTSMSRKVRRHLMNTGNANSSHNTRIIILATGLDECISRNIERAGKTLDTSILTRTAKRFTMPGDNEADEIVMLLPGEKYEPK